MSRPRSGRGASTVASPRQGARSAGAGRPGVFVQAPKSDIYVALLGVSLGAMFVGCLLLYLVTTKFPSSKPTGFSPPASSVAHLA